MAYTVQGHPVGPIGYGMMGLTIAARQPGTTPVPEERAIASLKEALNNGCNYWNGGNFYGSEENNSVTLLCKYFDKYPEDASKVVINIKGGLRFPYIMDCSPGFIKESIEHDLEVLGGRCFLHQFETGRKDPNVPYADTLGAINEFVKAGKVGGITLSEVNAKTIRKAAKTFKVEAVELMLSLFETGPMNDGVLETCAELGIPILAYSPLGHGFLTGQIRSADDIDEKDFRKMLPRFQPENFHLNMKLVEEVEKLAKKKGCTPAQIAINWLVTLSKRKDMPTIIPIPGASSPERVKENSTLVDLSEDDMTEIDTIIKSCVVLGERYPSHLMDMLDQNTE